jgi:RNase P subunit RPR2
MAIKKSEAVGRIANLIKEAKALAKTNTIISKRRVKAARRIAMKFHLKIPELKNDFCRKCNAYIKFNNKTRIKNKFRVVTCLECGSIRRIKLKTS